MKMSVFPAEVKGEIKAIASKSVAHRLLICSAFADKKTTLLCPQTNRDIEATAECLRALGATIERTSDGYEVIPINPHNIVQNSLLRAGESGSTLRFLLPITAMLGSNSTFLLEGRLPERPLSPLAAELVSHGITLTKNGKLLTVSGKLTGTHFSIDGGVSSQFVSGLLFACALSGMDTSLEITGSIESEPYIAITEDALSLFDIEFTKENNRIYKINGKNPPRSKGCLQVEGDWSNAAFPLCMGAISGEVTMNGLELSSKQGDAEILSILERFGAKITAEQNRVTVSRSHLHGIDINAKNIPDLVPVIAAVASIAEGRTMICGASRLRLKESDRLFSTSEMLRSLGADIEVTSDGLVICGKPHLNGGTVSAHNDHRIAMTAAVAALVCNSPVTVDGAEATEKSYPSFWKDIEKIAVKCEQLD